MDGKGKRGRHEKSPNTKSPNFKKSTNCLRESITRVESELHVQFISGGKPDITSSFTIFCQLQRLRQLGYCAPL